MTADLICGAVLFGLVATGVGYLLHRQIAERRSIPHSHLPSTLAAASALLAFVWFIAWTATDGLVPFGLPAFGVATALTALAFVIRPSASEK